MAQPMIGHRSTDFVALYQSLQPGLQALFGTKDPVYLSTSSAWGAMEGAVRNVTGKKVLNCMNGAFSDKWNDVALRCGAAAGALKFEWGQPVDPEAVRRELATGAYDAITLIHNETSCGCMSDLPAIMAGHPGIPGRHLDRRHGQLVQRPGDQRRTSWGSTSSSPARKRRSRCPRAWRSCRSRPARWPRAAQIEGRGYYFDFRRIPEEPRERHDPEHPGDPADLRPPVEAGGHRGRGARPRATRATPGSTRRCATGAWPGASSSSPRRATAR